MTLKGVTSKKNPGYLYVLRVDRERPIPVWYFELIPESFYQHGGEPSLVNLTEPHYKP